MQWVLDIWTEVKLFQIHYVAFLVIHLFKHVSAQYMPYIVWSSEYIIV